MRSVFTNTYGKDSSFITIIFSSCRITTDPNKGGPPDVATPMPHSVTTITECANSTKNTSTTTRKRKRTSTT